MSVNSDAMKQPGEGEHARKSLWRLAFSPAFFLFAAAALGTGVACYVLLGPDAVAAAFSRDVDLMLFLATRIPAAILIAGMVRALVPPEWIVRLIGGRSGLRGLLIATVAGIVTPGGPTGAFSMIAAMRVAGADRGAIVTYSVAWGLLGLQRSIIWEVAMLGAEFAILRMACCAPLPIVAGMLARRLPFSLRTPAEAGEGR